MPAHVLITGIAMPDGYGDIAHLADLLKCVGNEDVIIVIAYFADKKEPLFKSLRNHGLISSNTTVDDDCFAIHEKNPTLFLMQFNRENTRNDETPVYSDVEHETLLASKIYREKLKEIKVIFNISNSLMLDIFRGEKYKNEIFAVREPCLVHLPEHGCELDEKEYPIFDKQYAMGLKRGLFLSVPEKKDKKDIICSIEDKKFLSSLIGEAKGEGERREKAGQFLENNLFFPCYYKYEKSFLLYFLALMNSPICKESSKKEITLFTNIYYAQQGKEMFDFANKELVKNLYDAGISEVYFSDRVYDIQRLAVNHGFARKCAVSLDKHAEEQGKKVRILNLQIPHADFQKVYQLADYFAGCAGDKSVEVVFANRLVPLPEFRAYKLAFLDEMREYFHGTLIEKCLEQTKVSLKQNEDMVSLWQPQWNCEPIIQVLPMKKLIEIAKKMAEGMTLSAVSLAQEMIDKLIKEKNLFNSLPDIFANEVRAVVSPKKSYVTLSAFSPKRDEAEKEHEVKQHRDIVFV